MAAMTKSEARRAVRNAVGMAIVIVYVGAWVLGLLSAGLMALVVHFCR
jgi:hypothetical protein